MKNTEIAAYQYVHSHYRITELPWDSPWTWFFAFLAVDFGYYWAHRMSHGNVKEKKFEDKNVFDLRLLTCPTSLNLH